MDPAARRRALVRYPEALQQALDTPGVITWRRDAWDDTCVVVLAVEREGSAVYLERRVWFFDEDLLSWRSDSNELWEVPDDALDRLLAVLQA